MRLVTSLSNFMRSSPSHVHIHTHAHVIVCTVLQDWTIIRPGGLKSNPATGKAILTADLMASGELVLRKKALIRSNFYNASITSMKKLSQHIFRHDYSLVCLLFLLFNIVLNLLPIVFAFLFCLIYHTSLHFTALHILLIFTVVIT